jgi:CheY-like chemotaxis protein
LKVHTLHHNDENIRVLIADDDEHILDCYREAFGEKDATDNVKTLGALDAELFASGETAEAAPRFDIVACSQGDDAIVLARKAASDGNPFDVVILDIRMPPGLDGVEVGSQIRAIDREVEIVFVTGYSDVPRDELERRVPPPRRLHYYNKPLSFMKLAKDVAGFVNAH